MRDYVTFAEQRPLWQQVVIKLDMKFASISLDYFKQDHLMRLLCTTLKNVT